MSDDNGKVNKTTDTSTRTETREETGESEGLTAEEERVIRARRGLSEDDDHELKFGLGADEETAEALNRLESFLLKAFGERKTGEHFFPANRSDGDLEAADSEAKRKIIDALRDDED